MAEKLTITCPVFDGEKVYESATVTVEKGIITGFEVTDSEKTTDCFLMPGLIDGHVHISKAEQIKMFTDCGVTTVCDVAVSKEIKEKSDSLNIHTSYIMAFGDIEDGKAHVEKAVAMGADYIKLFIEIPPAMSSRTMAEDVLQDIVDTAHSHGLVAIVHAASVPAQEMAVKAGVDILLHTAMRTATPAWLVQAAAEKKLAFMPTILMMKKFTIEPFRDYEEQGFVYAQEAVKLFNDYGVPVLVGSDANDSNFVPQVKHGRSMFDEMEMLVDCGLSTIEVLQGATSKVADAFKIKDIGRIAVGKKADFILVKGRPDKNISHIRKIHQVYINGKAVK